MKPSIPKGTRDFLPAEVVKRKYMFSVIEDVFVKFGYQPIETSAMENLATLSGKYGEEGERLLFKVLNNGDFLGKADEAALAARDSAKLAPSIARRGLRFDLTVPFARFVVMHRNDIQLPFKRYQVQPVWRADRPQKGRYQEFYQCDVDVVGSDSLMYEAELIQIYDEVFHRLNLPVVIRLNHRKVLTGLAEVCGIQDHATDMTVAIDKLDKIGPEGVKSEMVNRGIPEASAVKVLQILENSVDLDTMAAALSNSSVAMEGIADLRSVMNFQAEVSAYNPVRVDIKLARGLDYYTGCIFEVEAPGYSAGSIGGGGRYDNLTGVFDMPGIPGVGVSFGAERIYDALDSLGLFPENLTGVPDVLILPMDPEVFGFAFKALTSIRQAGISADMYPEPAKMKKQMKYANGLGVPKVLIIGSEELKSGRLALKDMVTGSQEELPLEEVISTLK